jgi:hypothetical protein
MTTRVTRTQTHVAPRNLTATSARAAETPSTTNVPAEDPGALAKMGEFLEKSGISKKLSDAINAKSSDEVVAALTGGVAQLIVERTGVKDFDQKLHDDYKGTITAHVKNETAQKVLLTLGDIFGDKVASNMISAGMGALTGTTVELLKDDKFRELYKTDPKAFGLELAKRGGKNFGVALLAAWGTAKLEEALPAGLKWLAKIPFIAKLLGKG